MAQAPGLQEVFGAIGIPDVDILGRQFVGVRTATHKPEQLLCHSSPEDTLGGQQRELSSQTEPAQTGRAEEIDKCPLYLPPHPSPVGLSGMHTSCMHACLHVLVEVHALHIGCEECSEVSVPVTSCVHRTEIRADTRTRGHVAWNAVGCYVARCIVSRVTSW